VAEKPTWVGQSPSEVEELVVRLAKDGNPPSKIGVILRDQHGIPDVEQVTGKSMLEILEAGGVKSEVPEDLMNVIKQAVNLYGHMDRNPRDLITRRALEAIESRVHKMVKYYKRRGVLPPEWRYSRERAILLVRE
jgi:small subunit ribosomal protein S15